jgi:hypothetical protein
MKARQFSPVLAVALVLLAGCGPQGHSRTVKEYAGPDGSWDIATFDSKTRTAYFGRTYGVMAIDVDTGKLKPQVAPGARVHEAVPLDDGTLLFTNGLSGTVTIADPANGDRLATVQVGPDPDAAIYDSTTHLAYVMNGDAGFISIVDVRARKKAGQIEVGGKLEFPALDAAGNLFVNVEDRAEIAAIDTKTRKIIARFKLDGCEEPSGLAFVGRYNLLISSCANGHAKVIGAADGKEVADIAIGPHPDTVVYDAQRGLAFIPCAGSIFSNGSITVLRVAGARSVASTQSTPSAARGPRRKIRRPGVSICPRRPMDCSGI